jgi:hypothetical protein
MSIHLSRLFNTLALALVLPAALFPAADAAATEGVAPGVIHVTLANPALAASEQSRMNLKYLASCALEANVTLVGEVNGRRYEWPGSMGLAPQWHTRALTEEEERWVSACIFARTNYFGVRVELSLRSTFPSTAPGLRVDAKEARAYSVEEATFFGDVFRAQSTAYVCASNDNAERKARIAAHRRICALPLDQRRADGRQVTACGFVYVGACSAEKFTQGGVTYRQAVTVFLPPTPR